MICTMLEHWNDSLVLNIVNKFDTDLIKITRLETVYHRNCDFFINKGNNS